MERLRFEKVKRVLWIILFANILVAAFKIVIGTIINSASFSADGLHSLADGSSNIIGIISIGFAAKPIDEEHPYGHQKFETMASLLIGIMLFSIGIKLIIEAVDRVFNPVIPVISYESIIILFSTLIINVFVSSYEFNQGKKLKSEILVSDSIHTKSDIYISIGVIGTIIGIKLGLPYIIDSIMSFVVSIFIIKAGYEVFKRSSGILLDKSVVESEEIKNMVLNFEEVKQVHKIRSRGQDNHYFIDMHVKTNPSMNVREIHNLSHKIENFLSERLRNKVQVIIHVEPFEEIK